jgi:hypothetical protein
MACGDNQDCASKDCGTEVTNPPCPEPCPDKGCTPYEYRCGDWLVKVDSNGCVVRERVAINVADGVYTNPTITITDGCIAAISVGGRVIQQRPEPCQSSTTQPPEPPSISLNPSPCNLLSGGASSLLASIVFDQIGSDITVTGCGTPSSPARITYTGTITQPNAYTPTWVNGVAVQTPLVTPVTKVQSSTLNVTTSTTTSGVVTIDTVGVTYLNCGIDIQKGLVKQFLGVVQNVVGTAPITVSTNGCVKTVGLEYSALDYVQIKTGLGLLSSSKSLVGYTCGTAFVDPSASSPPGGAGSLAFGSAVVYGSRVYVNTPFPANVYDSAGSLVVTAPGFVTYGTPAAASAALDTYYTFTGYGIC